MHAFLAALSFSELVILVLVFGAAFAIVRAMTGGKS